MKILDWKKENDSQLSEKKKNSDSGLKELLKEISDIKITCQQYEQNLNKLSQMVDERNSENCLLIQRIQTELSEKLEQTQQTLEEIAQERSEHFKEIEDHCEKVREFIGEQNKKEEGGFWRSFFDLEDWEKSVKIGSRLIKGVNILCGELEELGETFSSDSDYESEKDLMRRLDALRIPSGPIHRVRDQIWD